MKYHRKYEKCSIYLFTNTIVYNGAWKTHENLDDNMYIVSSLIQLQMVLVSRHRFFEQINPNLGNRLSHFTLDFWKIVLYILLHIIKVNYNQDLLRFHICFKVDLKTIVSSIIELSMIWNTKRGLRAISILPFIDKWMTIP